MEEGQPRTGEGMETKPANKSWTGTQHETVAEAESGTHGGGTSTRK